MRVCLSHMKQAVTTLKDTADGTEYDLCQKCLDKIIPWLNGESKPGPKKGKDLNNE